MNFHIMPIPLENVRNPYADSVKSGCPNYANIYISEYERDTKNSSGKTNRILK